MAYAADGADLLMECDEEEQEVWPHSSDRNEGLKAAASPPQEEETMRIIPIPVSNCMPPIANNSVKPSAAPLGFMVNGRLVPQLPEGGGTELKLCSHPRGSASGFTTVHIPVTLTVHSLAVPRHIGIAASLISSSPKTSSPPSSPPGSGLQTTHTPIITGVVSGEAAQKVLSDHNVNFKSTNRLAAKSNNRSQPTAPHTLLRKGGLGPVSPPDCLVCKSPYKLIPELRGFICLCSPVIAYGLKTLKRKTKCNRWNRDKSKTSKDSQASFRVSKPQTVPSAPKVISPSPRTYRSSDEVLSDQFSSPTSSTNLSSPQQNQFEPLTELSHGKLVILVEDFYYGSASGPNSTNANVLSQKFTGPYCCIHCSKSLRNNIKLMAHMQQHVSVMYEHNADVGTFPSCPRCFRHFQSPFKLQCHLEAVHSQCKSTVTCKICELDFGSEPSFLWHMKNTHKPGEMPYVCQVCDFRSSFYSDVWTHFQEAHADTKYLLCQYCLRVLRSNTCYQQHFARHQRKHVFGCDKCRLQFLYTKERVEHNMLHHRTHIRPSQLTGLKPGTKVTVRTYSVVGGSENEEGLKKPAAPCKVVDVDPPPPTQEVPKRKPVESLALLLSSLSQDSDHRPSRRCVECLSWVRDFRTHFPSLVHCSLCKFITCCSTSYANHMINNHATCRKTPPYRTIFQSDLRLSLRLECVLCKFSTSKGDTMANHLMERPEHGCVMLMQPEFKEVKSGLTSDSTTPPVGQGPGAFVPIQLLPSRQSSTQLSVKPLTSSCPLSTSPAMTIRFLGPLPPPQQSPVSSLGVSQLSAVLSSLCHGVSLASQQHHTAPEEIQLWTKQQEHDLGGKKWYWRTDKMAQWLLIQREQQLMVREDVLLQTTKTALGERSSLLDCYSWTVDFMLRHGLSLQPRAPISSRKHKLPKRIREDSRTFMKSFCLQLQNKRLPPKFMACMDEFSIFIDSDGFSNQNPAAFQLFASSGDKPVFDVVLSALSDGTFLPPLLFFTGALSPVPDGFPENILLESRQDGFSDQERLQIWINKVWQPCVASSVSLLMADIYRGHLCDWFRESLSCLSTDVAYIPSGCSFRLQPLDVCVTSVLRDFLQAKWTQLVSQGGLDGLRLDQLAVTLACWLSEVSFTLNSRPDMLCRSFISVCNLQHLDDRQEATDMIQALTKILVQPLETPAPKPEQLQLLLVMEGEVKVEDKWKEERKVEDTRAQEQSPVGLHRVFEGDSDQETFHGFRDEDMDKPVD